MSIHSRDAGPLEGRPTLDSDERYVVENFELISYNFAFLCLIAGILVFGLSMVTGVFLDVADERGILVAMALFMLPMPLLLIIGGLVDVSVRRRYRPRVEELRRRLPPEEQAALVDERARGLTGWSVLLLIAPMIMLLFDDSVYYPSLVAISFACVSLFIARIRAPYGRFWYALGLLQLPIAAYAFVAVGDELARVPYIAAMGVLLGVLGGCFEQWALLRRTLGPL